jgi:drug/metabolite transporter (DMT)-like permease
MISKIRKLSAGIEKSISSKDAKSRMWIGASSIAFASFLFAMNSTIVKQISGHYSAWMISFIRFFIGILLVLVSLRITARKIKINNWKILFLRGFFGALQMVIFFVGIKLTSSGRCTLLQSIYPVFVALFGYILFKERFSKSIIVVMLLAFAGATLVFYDGSSYPLFGNAFCLLSGVMQGINLTFVKKARDEHDSFIVYLSPCIIGLIITSFSITEVPAIASVSDAGLIVLVGVIAFVGQIFIGFGFKYVKATVGSIVAMSELLFSISLSFFLIAEEMPPKFFIGTFLIIIALVFNHAYMKRDHR